MIETPSGITLTAARTQLLETLNYTFEDVSGFEAALRHPSADKAKLGARAKQAVGPLSFERLEFLGDRVLGLTISERLFGRFPNEDEGALAKRHAVLVSGETVARVAETLNLAPCILYGNGQPPESGKERQVVLSDACEALLGAIYLDGGLDAAAQRILPLWEPLIDEELRPPRDPKTTLQELVQSVGLPLPHYQTVSSDGPSHAPHFVVEVSVEGADSQRGEGRSKRAAQTEAAEAMISILNTSPKFARSARIDRTKSQSNPTGERKS